MNKIKIKLEEVKKELGDNNPFFKALVRARRVRSNNHPLHEKTSFVIEFGRFNGRLVFLLLKNEEVLNFYPLTDRGFSKAFETLDEVFKEWEAQQPVYQTLELKDLVGEHQLSGVDDVTDHGDYSCSVLLDGKTLKVIEDPDDGYRSFLGGIYVTDFKVKNTFPSHAVIGVLEDDGEIITFTDKVTGKEVLSFGTGDNDDYYPFCLFSWMPQNLLINSK